MKTEKKHTPGPWNIRFFRDAEPSMGFFVQAANNNMPNIGYGIEIMQEDFGDHNGYPLEQRLADAILIAGAPDLLLALQNIVAYENRCREKGNPAISDHWLEICEQAIKKATGVAPLPLSKE